MNPAPRVPADDDPPAAALAEAPASWYYLGSRAELARGPLRFALPGGKTYVGYRAENGKVAVLSARCSHMGADLAKGCVRGDRIVCPLHGWEYDTDGRCLRIPAAEHTPAPPFARQIGYPVVECGDQIFFFSEPTARFPAPFFEGVEPAELRAAAAFDLHDTVPWYFIGANGFDVQHFRNAHDRVLLEEPAVDAPHKFARRISLRLGVAGASLSDRFTRWFAGPELTMTVTIWGGTLIFVRAKFRRTTTYGLMTVRPVENHATHARVVVWVRRSEGALGRVLFDRANAWLRRRFIRQFLRSDLGRMSGVRYHPDRLIEADKYFRDYMEWLRQLPR